MYEFPKPIMPMENLSDRPYLVCPTCACQYVHLTRVCYAVGEYENRGVALSSNGLRFDQFVPSLGRGEKVVMEFYCESGHRFAYVFQFHKGYMFLHRLVGKEMEEG